MKKKQKISIVLPTYNRARYIGRAISSVLRQTHANWELIIIDNHSADDTETIVRGYSDSRIFYKKISNNGVIAKSRNEGIRLSTGEFVAFLDSDDWWASNKLKLSLDSLNRGAAFVYHDLYLVSKGFRQQIIKRRMRSEKLKSPVFLDLLLNGNKIPTSSVVTRAELMSAVGGFSEDKDLITVEDYDAWLKIARRSDAFTRIKCCAGYYNYDGNNLSATALSIPAHHKLLQEYSSDLKKNGVNEPAWYRWMLLKDSFTTHYCDSGFLIAVEKCLPQIKDIEIYFTFKKILQHVFKHVLS